ncbi:kelch-like protein 1 isoform X1 [Zeugodacus cucurbitae]|uniref:kelch-like protein 1 isoform X1 n=1 Tax=Zeugodacus cucurbitae TaxID=28588 RepID=UPI0023D93210|nr:kelch-like protein 1 isoform X1 [Zeugodacus cucurbitae]XP_054088012.1 kelch-like protein 1 isoform X1 [Zeugodacus cucurbitae]
MFSLQLAAMVSRNFPQYRVNSEANTFKLHSLRVLLRYKTSNGWKFVAPLLKARYDAGAVAFNGKIYIMGGNWYNGYLKSVECYNTDSKSWSKCADMRYNHVKPAVAVHNGHIYVFGAYYGSTNRGVVERYDPQRDTWSQICSLEGDPWGILAFVSFDNKLWTIGHRSEQRITGVAVYDEANDNWVRKRSLPKGEIYSCFVVSLPLLTSK